MATSGEKTWPRMGRNRWPLTPGSPPSLSVSAISAHLDCEAEPGCAIRTNWSEEFGASQPRTRCELPGDDLVAARPTHLCVKRSPNGRDPYRRGAAAVTAFPHQAGRDLHRLPQEHLVAGGRSLGMRESEQSRPRVLSSSERRGTGRSLRREVVGRFTGNGRHYAESTEFRDWSGMTPATTPD